MLSFDDAFGRILAAAHMLGNEDVALADAAGRVLAGPVTASRDQPPFDASAMDGYAVRAADIAPGAMLKLIGRAEAGHRFAGELGAGECVRILTGASVPDGADAVVMQEETEADNESIRFLGAAKPGQNIRQTGNDFAMRDELLPAGTLLTPFRLALAAAANRAHLNVCRRPRVTLVSTGDELVQPGGVPGPDQIVASNAPALAALFSPAAARIIDAGIVEDSEIKLAEALTSALEDCDVLVTIGGASVGDRDYVLPVLQSLGVQLDFWKIAMRPGKPLIFGTKGRKLVFGLPGNPVSALVTARTLVLPALRAKGGGRGRLGTRSARLTAPLPANGARRHFLRGTLSHSDDGALLTTPFSQTDSAHLSSLAAADCLIVQVENNAGMGAGERVEIIPLVD